MQPRPPQQAGEKTSCSPNTSTELVASASRARLPPEPAAHRGERESAREPQLSVAMHADQIFYVELSVTRRRTCSVLQQVLHAPLLGQHIHVRLCAVNQRQAAGEWRLQRTHAPAAAGQTAAATAARG